MEAAPGLQRLEAELAARRQADAGRQEAGVASPRARIEALAEDGFFELGRALDQPAPRRARGHVTATAWLPASRRWAVG